MSVLRQPGGVVKINGTAIPGWIQFSVTNNSFYEADVFEVTFASSAMQPGQDANWLSSLESDTFVEIFAGFPASQKTPTSQELHSLIYGRIDDITLDPIQKTVTITGRDLTGAFIDTKVSSQYTNQTASQIANTLASNHGVQADITTTTAKVGNYFNNDTVLIQANRSEWDLLSTMAQGEGFVVVMKGQQLYFGEDTTGTGTPLYITLNQGNANAWFTCSRSMTVAKGISVTVMSAPSQKGGKSVVESYPIAPKGTTPGKASPYGSTTNYKYKIFRGADPITAKQKAQAIYKQIISHAMKLRITQMPADLTTNPTSAIKVTGTGTAFDQTYYPRSITRTMTFGEGFTMEIDAQNTSPNLTPADT
jgi:prophage tail gpP-like protein